MDAERSVCGILLGRGPLQKDNFRSYATDFKHWLSSGSAQNPLDPFPRSFSVDGKVANLSRTCYVEATEKLM